MREGEVIDGRYQLVRKVGEGGMGSVFRAVDQSSGEPVAVKFLLEGHDEDRARFAREADLLAELSHPGIVRYIAHGQTSAGTDYIAMEWVDGDTLTDRLRDGLTVEQSVALARRLAGALGAAHVRDVIHRDIKPGNVLFPAADVAEAKLADFGIARRTGEVSGLTQTGVMVGTPPYMAPEQARAERTVDARADVFGLGCLLYQCLAGEPPFGGGFWLAVRLKVLLSEPAPLGEIRDDIPPALAELVERMLAKDPDERPADGRAVEAELERIAEDLGPPGAGRAPAPPAPGTAPAAARLSAVANEDGVAVDAAIVVALTEQDEDDDVATDRAAVAELDRRLRDALGPFGAQLEVMGDGAVTARVSAPGGTEAGEDVIARAARCAMAMRELLPDAVISLSTVARGAPVGPTIERSVHTVVKTALDAIFEEPAPDTDDSLEILLDERSAAALESTFRIDRRGGRRVLRGEP